MTDNVNDSLRIQSEKNAIRKIMRERRAEISLRERQRAGQIATDMLFSDRALYFFSRFRMFASYISMDEEFSTEEIHYHVLANSPYLYVPRYSEMRQAYQWALLSHGTMLEPGPFRIPQPPHQAVAMSTSDVDVVFVPGLCFDVRGGRIGYGKGIYDRLLRQLRPTTLKVALAFNCQVQRESLPIEPHDVMMDYIVTEESWIDCRRARQVRRS